METLNIGLEGLQVTTRAIDVSSTNIANAGTVGYKSSEYLFAEEIFRATQATDARSGGSGVSEIGVKRDFQQGTLRTSTSALDLAISGQGMFRLASSNVGQTDASTVFYSRNGQYSVDSQGYIVNANGLFLTGYQAAADGLSITQTLGALRIPAGPAEPRATTDAGLAVTLDARKAVPVLVDPVTGVAAPNVFNPLDATTYSDSTSLTVYDAQGVQRNVTVYYKRVPDANVAIAPPITDPVTQLPVAQAQVTQYQVYASVDGVFLNTPAAAGAPAIAVQGGALPAFAAGGGVLQTLQFYNGTNVDRLQGQVTGLPIQFQYQVAAGAAAPTNNVLGFALDLTDTTNFAQAFANRGVTQDGYAGGGLSSIRVDESGRVIGEYTNGKSLYSGQVILANFTGSNGLALLGPNVFVETAQSGVPTLGTATVNGFGAIRGNSLEESNTDLASELVELIVQQRNYQANAQSVRAGDSMLTTVINLGR